MPDSNNFYITTPIYYVNAKPHIGHTYTTIAADVLARYHRLAGDKTFFSTGTDEHGAKISQKAEAEGKEAGQFADEISATFQLAWKELNISNDSFIRTTDPAHVKAVQKALDYMHEKGDIYLDKYEGYYCTGCEQFKNEKDLVDGKCPDHQTEPEWTSEESYVFKMSKYAEILKAKIQNDELAIFPKTKKNEVLSFLEKEGLRDVSFSRKNVKWGIPLPWDPAHTAYVWSDAFLNYLTVLGWSGNGGECPEMFPPDLQLMSKDILRVHATIWPAMLLSLDLPLQKAMFVHGFFLVEGQKMSKSIGNVIAPEELCGRYGADATRYLLASATSFGRDGDISWGKFDEKYTSDLANGLGNLVARTTTLAGKLRAGGNEIPECCQRPEDINNWGGKTWDQATGILWEKYEAYMNSHEIDKALGLVVEQVSKIDQYLAEEKPWKTIKTEPEKAGIVLYNALENLRLIAIMLLPFMPTSAEQILSRIGLKAQDLSSLEKEKEFGRWQVKLPISKGDSLFPRLTDAE